MDSSDSWGEAVMLDILKKTEKISIMLFLSK